MTSAEFDREMMALAIAMARRGLGSTAPNPAVGAVIADEAAGEVIARGWTQPGGRPHAETEAIRRAGERARGRTMYVSLEPCAHHGRTGPCAEAILAAGLARVVIGVLDPDPRTAGKGVEILAAGGVATEIGVLDADARWVTLGHILRVTERRPFVTLKIAVSGSGEVPRGEGGRPTFVTGTEARALGHLLRAEADAILVGAGTVRDDDPDLTCRLPGLEERSPLRVVVSGSLDLPVLAKVVETARVRPTLIVTHEGAPLTRREELELRGARVIAVADGGDGRPQISRVTAALADEGVTRLLVEGGSRIWAAFAAEGLVDEVMLVSAGREADPHALAARYVPGVRLRLHEVSRRGGDFVYALRREI